MCYISLCASGVFPVHILILYIYSVMYLGQYIYILFALSVCCGCCYCCFVVFVLLGFLMSFPSKIVEVIYFALSAFY